MMKPSFYNLVVVSPGDPRIVKFHISRKVILMLVVAFLVSFLVTVAVAYTISRLSNSSSGEQIRLEKENQALAVQNKNAAIRNQKLEAQLDGLEKLTDRVNALLQSAD
jgi:mannitol-specific phosphotransferase system IIBC component